MSSWQLQWNKIEAVDSNIKCIYFKPRFSILQMLTDESLSEHGTAFVGVVVTISVSHCCTAAIVNIQS